MTPHEYQQNNLDAVSCPHAGGLILEALKSVTVTASNASVEHNLIIFWSDIFSTFNPYIYLINTDQRVSAIQGLQPIHPSLDVMLPLLATRCNQYWSKGLCYQAATLTSCSAGKKLAFTWLLIQMNSIACVEKNWKHWNINSGLI